MDNMKAKEAEKALQNLIGRDLQKVAKKLGIEAIGPKGGLKKGWAGDVVETYITGRKDNSPQADFEDSELKIVPLTLKKTGALRVKNLCQFVWQMKKKYWQMILCIHMCLENLKVC